jgi:hypothetical protein
MSLMFFSNYAFSVKIVFMQLLSNRYKRLKSPYMQFSLTRLIPNLYDIYNVFTITFFFKKSIYYYYFLTIQSSKN